MTKSNLQAKAPAFQDTTLQKLLFGKLISAVPEAFRHLCPDFEKFGNLCSFSLHRISPVKTLSISVTGNQCKLKCSHCESHYLNGMTPLTSLDKIDFNRYQSLLISGGSDENGKVPISENFEKLANLPEHLSLNIHPGYQSVEAFLKFKNGKNIISFDLPGSDEVIEKVFHLPYSHKDYQKLFLDFSDHFVTIPHITIGLNFGLNSDEERSIDFLSENSPEMLVFIVLRPTPNTAMADSPTPTIERIIELLSYARKKLNCPIQLGCMRPSGFIRRAIDIISWMNGIDRIVMPDHELIKILEEFKISVYKSSECCAFTRE